MSLLESSPPPAAEATPTSPGFGVATPEAEATSSSADLVVDRLPAGDAAAAAAWDAFVAAAPGSSFCHLAGWRDVIRSSLRLETVYLRARQPDGALAGVLPLVRIRSRLFGHSLISVPYLNEGGPLGAPAAQRALLQHATAEAQATRAGLLELRARQPLPETPGLGAARRKITVLLDLPPTAEELFARRFTTKLRTKIRRAQKEGMEVRFGPQLEGAFYHVLAHKLRDLGTPVHPRAFFQGIARHFPDRVQFSAVYAGDVVVAAGCGFFWNGEYEITWSGALRQYMRLNPNMVLYWALMEEAIRRGATVFSFGRCTPGGGTHEFKRQWGSRDVELPWRQWPDGGPTAPSGEGAGLRLATDAWKRLPLGVANRLGPVLARRIPTY